jgi:FdhD protein
MPESYISTPITRYRAEHGSERLDDTLIVEAPLEIRVDSQPLTITMRTPGDDLALAAGLLLCEGVIKSADDIYSLRHCNDNPNLVRIELSPGVPFEASRLSRNFVSSSSCGLCGKTSMEALAIRADRQKPGTITLDAKLVHRMPELLRDAQKIFRLTGASHAAGLFDVRGNLLALHEDVGRHNAVDKLIGQRVLSETPIEAEHILCISSRASFEIVQKAVTAGLSTVIAVGAPSSLAVDVAKQFHIRLIAFAGAKHFNVYAGQDTLNLE